MDNNFKEKSQYVFVKYLDIMSNHNVKLAGYIQNLVSQCLMYVHVYLSGFIKFYP